MLKASRNSLTSPGLPLSVFCAVRNPFVRNQRLRARTVHSSGKKPEEEPAKPAEPQLKGYQGFTKSSPAVIKSWGSKWNPTSPVTTGSSDIDRAILSSFGSKNTGASWPRSDGASGPPRINRRSGYGQQELKPGGRTAQNGTGSGYQGFTREVRPPVQGSAAVAPQQGGYIPRSGYTPRDGYNQRDAYNSKDGYSQRGGDYPRDGYNQRNAYNPRDRYSQRGGQYSRDGYNQRGEQYPRDGYSQRDGYNSKGEYNKKDGYNPKDGYNQRDGYNSKGEYNKKDGYNPKDGYNQRDGYNSKGEYNKEGGLNPKDGYNQRDGRVEFTPTGFARPQIPSNESNIQNQQTWNAIGSYQPLVQKPVPFIKSEEVIIRPSEPEYNDYQKRRAGRSRDKSQKRLVLDGYESAILEEGGSHKDRKAAKKAKKREKKDNTPKMIPLYLPEYISVPNLARALKVRLEDFTMQMEEMGFTEVSHDHILNAEIAGLIAMEYNYEPIIDNSKERDLLPRSAPENRSVLPKRPPVVTIMGHVDHGKTSLLDWLRKASVAATEHGGITQHIGAFSVNMPGGKNITFLDTPGHAAFLTMRERGANVTDIIILVVAADDSVKPQTIEAINHAKAANVPIIVAVNKIDKEDADADKVKQDLARYGVTVEDYGGDTQVVCVSAKTGQGMDELEEATVTLSEILDMRAEDDGPCEGWVLEAGTKRGGHIATVLVRRGTLRLGDSIVAGETWAKVRQLLNEHGVGVKSAPPGAPVQVFGWKNQPEAGQLAIQADSEAKAKDVIEFRREKAERLQQAADMEAINEKKRLRREREEKEAIIREEAKAKKEDPDAAVLAWEKAAKQEVSTQPTFQEVEFIVKGDVSGSVEAVVGEIKALGNEEVAAKVVRSSFGNVSEFDVDYAAAVEGCILCFNLSPDPEVIIYARNKGITILTHNIIYRLVEDVKRLLSDRLAPTVITKVTGEAEIAEIFNYKMKRKQTKPFAGCKVNVGVIAKSNKVKVIRGGKTMFDGILGSLKHVKDDVMEMKNGAECGMGFENWDKFQVGDMVQCYETKSIPRSL